MISMLGDVIYETARSANSQYLSMLEISASQVGFVFGIGEFIGYFFRLFAGVLSDRTGKHWVFIFIGYGMLLVVPLMGFTMNWNVLVTLMLMERIGKSLRNPAKDTIVSRVAENQVGIGFAFGLQEFLDQLGAFAGPLIFTVVFIIFGKSGIREYQLGYKLLLLPFLLLMAFLTFAHRKIEREHLIEKINLREFRQDELPPIFWLYTIFTFFCTLGFLNFSTIGYHLKASHLMSDGDITLLYSFAMAIDAISALVIGKYYDKLKQRVGSKTGGILILIGLPLITMSLPLLTLTKSKGLIIAGMIIFGVIMGAHETVIRSAIADLTPFYKRGTSYGIFNTAYGLALFLGAYLMGVFYQHENLQALMITSFSAEIIAMYLFKKIHRLVMPSA